MLVSAQEQVSDGIVCRGRVQFVITVEKLRDARLFLKMSARSREVVSVVAAGLSLWPKPYLPFHSTRHNRCIERSAFCGNL